MTAVASGQTLLEQLPMTTDPAGMSSRSVTDVSTISMYIDAARAFPSGDRQTITFVDDRNGWMRLRGNGQVPWRPGHVYECTKPAASHRSDKDGNVTTFDGTWTFTPDVEVADRGDLYPHGRGCGLRIPTISTSAIGSRPRKTKGRRKLPMRSFPLRRASDRLWRRYNVEWHGEVCRTGNRPLCEEDFVNSDGTTTPSRVRAVHSLTPF